MLKENAHCSECQVIVSLHKSIVLYYMLLCDLKKGESNMYRRDDYITGPSRQNSVGLCAISFIVMIIHYVIVMIAMFMDNGNDFLRNHPANKIQEIFISITQDGTACLVWEITAVILFIAAAISIKRSHKRDMSNTPALLAQMFSLLTAFPLVYFVRQFFEWLPENWTDICQSCFDHRQIILFIVTLVVFVVIDFFLIRNRFGSQEFSIFGNKDSFLNYLFFCVILLHEVRFLWNYAGIGHFIVSAANSSVQERITLTFFVLFLIALIAVMIHCKRTEGQLSLLMWINIGGCIWGMTPVLYSIGEKKGLFHKYSIWIVIILIMALLGFVLWNLNYWKIKETLVIKKLLKGNHGIFVYSYITVCFLVLCIEMIFFLHWLLRLSQQKLDNLFSILPQIILMIILAIVFAVVVIFVLGQLGIYIVRTIKEIEKIGKRKHSSKYKLIYGVHGISALFPFIVSIISWFVYAKIDYTDEKAIGVAGDVFHYFSFPVIVLVWYTIMYHLLKATLDRKCRRAKKLKSTIKKNVFTVAEGFVDSIFAPFRLFFNFFVELFNSINGDD